MEIVEIAPDLWEAMKTKRRKKLSNEEIAEEEEEEEEGTPLRGMFCLKTRQEDMKPFEEKEDCFILDFDPSDSFDSSFSDNPEGGDDDDVAIIHEKGQVACRDFPHPRHLCLKYPFGSTQHSLHCNQCYCYVCDLAAPCPHWTLSNEPHCEALENSRWRSLRELHRGRRGH
ncbi:unnamed protein product [Brassica rapa]|uniref:Uncharacterized protein n=1 Tax=Brassica campestris TaxID=3711 RepID=A0A3P6A313_BRACM|nr:unnamed protein product [Brassica rapa]VDC83595.1 unnamed protein product [Brassica rapa]